jgi:hypothetical protein
MDLSAEDYTSGILLRTASTACDTAFANVSG